MVKHIDNEKLDVDRADPTNARFEQIDLEFESKYSAASSLFKIVSRLKKAGLTANLKLHDSTNEAFEKALQDETPSTKLLTHLFDINFNEDGQEHWGGDPLVRALYAKLVPEINKAAKEIQSERLFLHTKPLPWSYGMHARFFSFLNEHKIPGAGMTLVNLASGLSSTKRFSLSKLYGEEECLPLELRGKESSPLKSAFIASILYRIGLGLAHPKFESFQMSIPEHWLKINEIRIPKSKIKAEHAEWTAQKILDHVDVGTVCESLIMLDAFKNSALKLSQDIFPEDATSAFLFFKLMNSIPAERLGKGSSFIRQKVSEYVSNNLLPTGNKTDYSRAAYDGWALLLALSPIETFPREIHGIREIIGDRRETLSVIARIGTDCLNKSSIEPIRKMWISFESLDIPLFLEELKSDLTPLADEKHPAAIAMIRVINELQSPDAINRLTVWDKACSISPHDARLEFLSSHFKALSNVHEQSERHSQEISNLAKSFIGMVFRKEGRLEAVIGYDDKTMEVELLGRATSASQQVSRFRRSAESFIKSIGIGRAPIAPDSEIFKLEYKKYRVLIDSLLGPGEEDLLPPLPSVTAQERAQLRGFDAHDRVIIEGFVEKHSAFKHPTKNGFYILFGKFDHVTPSVATISVKMSAKESQSIESTTVEITPLSEYVLDYPGIIRNILRADSPDFGEEPNKIKTILREILKRDARMKSLKDAYAFYKENLEGEILEVTYGNNLGRRYLVTSVYSWPKRVYLSSQDSGAYSPLTVDLFTLIEGIRFPYNVAGERKFKIVK